MEHYSTALPRARMDWVQINRKLVLERVCVRGRVDVRAEESCVREWMEAVDGEAVKVPDERQVVIMGAGPAGPTAAYGL